MGSYTLEKSLKKMPGKSGKYLVMEAGFQVWVCKTCNCAGGLVKMATTSAQVPATSSAVGAWSPGKNVNGGAYVAMSNAGGTKKTCLAACETYRKAHPTYRFCAKQCNGCYAAAALIAAPGSCPGDGYQMVAPPAG